MKKYFLGSVGKAEAFRMENGKLHLAFVSKTLTDSGLNVSTTKDDIRGGTGAPIQFSFFHDPSVEITLTDIVYNHEYITAQLGKPFSEAGEGNNVDYITLPIETGAADPESETTHFTLGEVVQPLPLPCDGDKYFVWGTIAGVDDYKEMELDSDHKTILNLQPNTKYCIRYLAKSTKSRMAEITSMIIPEELYLVITAPIYAGDACSASKGKAAGRITFEVPRFQLNGAQEFSMNMSSNQTMSLAGIALASDSEECDSMGGKLFRIIEVLDDTDYKKNIVNLIVAEESAVAGSTPSVYGELESGKLVNVDNDDLEFAPLLNEGHFEDKTLYTITLKGYGVSEQVEIGTGYTLTITAGNTITTNPEVATLNAERILRAQTISFNVSTTAAALPIASAIVVTGTGDYNYTTTDTKNAVITVTGDEANITITIPNAE